MSTNLEYRAREIQGKRGVGGRQAKLNEKKKGDRDLGRRVKKQSRHFFLLKERQENFVAAMTK